jgi:hypothetical protein
MRTVTRLQCSFAMLPGSHDAGDCLAPDICGSPGSRIKGGLGTS